MEIVQCSACGSKELQLSEGMLICVYCRSRHLPDASTGGNFEAFEKKTGLDVVLEDGGKQKIAVIKAVVDLTKLGLKDAKDLVEGAPQTVIRQVTLEAANKAKQQLESKDTYGHLFPDSKFKIADFLDAIADESADQVTIYAAG